MKVLVVGVFEELNPASTNIQQVNALRRMGHEVITYPYRYNRQKFGPMLEVNLLTAMAQEQQPDIIWFNKCNGLDPRATKQLTDELNFLTIEWYMDPIGVSYVPEVKQHMVNCDYAVFASKEAALHAKNTLGITAYHINDGIDFSTHDPEKVEQDPSLICDVSFIGNVDAYRISLLSYLAGISGDLDFRIWGGGWGTTPLKKYWQGGPAENEKFAAVAQHSKINLATQRDQGRSIRTFWLLGSKGFVLHEKFYELEEEFADGVHMIMFEKKNFKQMGDLITDWVTDRRRQARYSIAKAGHDFVRENFTWDKTFEKLFTLIGGEEGQKEFAV